MQCYANFMLMFSHFLNSQQASSLLVTASASFSNCVAGVTTLNISPVVVQYYLRFMI